MRTLNVNLVRALAAALVVAAVPNVIGQTTTQGEASNATPTVGALSFYTSAPSASSTCPAGAVTSFAPNAGTVRDVHICAVVSDGNGWNDVCGTGATRTFTVLTSAGGSTTDASHDKEAVTMTCATGSGTDVAITGSFQMEHWRAAGTGVSAYDVTVNVADVAAATASNTGSFDWTGATAIGTPSSTINLGSGIAPNAQGSDVAVSLYNDANTAFTITIHGSTNLVGQSKTQNLAIANLKWATAASTAYGAKTTMTDAAASTGVSATVDTSDTRTTQTLYLQLGIPAASGATWTPADTYSGSVTFGTS